MKSPNTGSNAKAELSKLYKKAYQGNPEAGKKALKKSMGTLKTDKDDLFKGKGRLGRFHPRKGSGLIEL